MIPVIYDLCLKQTLETKTIILQNPFCSVLSSGINSFRQGKHQKKFLHTNIQPGLTIFSKLFHAKFPFLSPFCWWRPSLDVTSLPVCSKETNIGFSLIWLPHWTVSFNQLQSVDFYMILLHSLKSSSWHIKFGNLLHGKKYAQYFQRGAHFTLRVWFQGSSSPLPCGEVKEKDQCKWVLWHCFPHNSSSSSYY